MPRRQRLEGNELARVLHIKNELRMVLPVYAICRLIEKFDILPVLGVPARELPVQQSLHVIALDDDVPGHQIDMREDDATIGPLGAS